MPERILFEARPHILVLLLWELAFIGVAVFLYLFLRDLLVSLHPLAPLLSLVPSILLGLLFFLDWFNTIYTATNRRFLLEFGFPFEVRREISLSEVQTLNFVRGIVGFLIGFGTLRIESAGRTSIEMRALPTSAYRAIRPVRRALTP